MRNWIGAAVFVAGVAGLGIWGAQYQADRMETQIRAAAQTVGETALHDVVVEVSGRDISVSGYADSAEERDTLLAALDDVEGRRVIEDNLQVLPAAKPFSFAVTRKGGRSIMQGNVPTEAMRDALAQSGADGADALTLASGAPDRWEAAIGAGLAALSKMDEGVLSAEGMRLRLSGLVDTPEDRDAIEAALTLPEGYDLSSDIETRDDGKPVDFTIAYSAMDGVEASGKLPAGLDLDQIASALGVAQVSGDAAAGRPGTDQPVVQRMQAVAGWLPELETATLRFAESGTTLEGAVTPGADPGIVARAISQDLGDGMNVRLRELQDLPRNGAARTHAVTGASERFVNGFWLPDVSFTPSLQACTAQSEQMLKRAKINFLSGSAQLGPRAIRAINAVASVVRRCVNEAGLRAEIGGHTDNTGTGNFPLSADRAVVVLNAMIARGVPADALNAVGFGASRPIADNSTEAGRAANRRTTIQWAR